MASSGGIGGGGGGAVVFGDAQITEGGQIQVSGEDVDVATAEGAAALMGAVSPEDLAAIKAMLQLKETGTPPVLVPDDSYRRVDTRALRTQMGPQSVDEGKSELDAELGAWFESQGMPNPYNANTTPDLEASLKTGELSKISAATVNPGAEGSLFDATVRTGTAALENPSAANNAEFFRHLNAIQAANPNGNIMEVLFLVFRESIQEVNEDKKYFLLKLQEFNKMGEQLSDYLSELVEVSRDLGARAAGAKYPEMVLTAKPVDVKKFDLTTLGTDGKLHELPGKPAKPLDRAGLNDTIKEVESMQETVRNKRQMASTAFQNFDQKSNQLYNLMASVMKAFNEMRSGTIRNML